MSNDSKVISINPYSLASYYVELYYGDDKIGNATCFFTKRQSQLYLVTNLHVVTGVDTDTRAYLDDKGRFPQKMRIFLPQVEDGAIVFTDEGYLELDLYDKDDIPLWYELKIDDKRIDIAIIPINQQINGYFEPIESAAEPFNESVPFEIASDIYVVGFPFGRIGGVLPIWKRASVASEPEVDIDNMPYFFADTASRSGMSGSPVIYYSQRPVTIINEKEGKFSRHWTKFVGVYSGRIGANEKTEAAQLGRIWKAEIIDSIIEANINK